MIFIMKKKIEENDNIYIHPKLKKKFIISISKTQKK